MKGPLIAMSVLIAMLIAGSAGWAQERVPGSFCGDAIVDDTEDCDPGARIDLTPDPSCADSDRSTIPYCISCQCVNLPPPREGALCGDGYLDISEECEAGVPFTLWPCYQRALENGGMQTPPPARCVDCQCEFEEPAA